MREIEINKSNLETFINNIRKQDLEELIYFLGDDYKEKFVDFVLKNPNNTYFLEYNSTPSCIGGAYCEGDSSQVWLLCSEKFDKKFLLNYSKEKIEKFKNESSYLYNYIYKSNFKFLRWLKKLGFKVKDTNNPDIKLFYYGRENKI